MKIFKDKGMDGVGIIGFVLIYFGTLVAAIYSDWAYYFVGTATIIVVFLVANVQVQGRKKDAVIEETDNK
ncbi:MAG: hypothetical protein U9R08_03480 [Nanoarchaeota archaeon]|nr:hypothetical protein [Nanoarchaeota archaeon]